MSFHLDGKVDAPTIYRRKRKLMALQRKISRARHRALVGSERTVLVEGPSADSELVWQARLETQAPEIDGVCYISDPGEQPLQAGQFRRMRITKAHDYDLVGELEGGLQPARGFCLASQAKACATILPNPTGRNAETPARICSAPFVIRK